MQVGSGRGPPRRAALSEAQSRFRLEDLPSGERLRQQEACSVPGGASVNNFPQIIDKAHQAHVGMGEQ